MNMKCNPLWLLVVCIVIGRLISPVTGTHLFWERSLRITSNVWHFELSGAPDPRLQKYDVKLLQVGGGDSVEIKSWNSDELRMTNVSPSIRNICFQIRGDEFNGGPKIVMAELRYRSGAILPSTTLNLDDLARAQKTEMAGVVMVWVVGGICIIALIVGVILCCRRRRRRVGFQQPVAVMGQAPIMVQGQNYQVQQAVPQIHYV